MVKKYGNEGSIPYFDHYNPLFNKSIIVCNKLHFITYSMENVKHYFSEVWILAFEQYSVHSRAINELTADLVLLTALAM